MNALIYHTNAPAAQSAAATLATANQRQVAGAARPRHARMQMGPRARAAPPEAGGPVSTRACLFARRAAKTARAHCDNVQPASHKSVPLFAH